MIDDRKTWLIEPGDVLDVMAPDKKQPVTIKVNSRYDDTPRSTVRPTVSEPVKRRLKPVRALKSKLQFATLAIWTYLLGPLAILLTPRGRRQKSTLVLAGLSVAATLTLVVGRFGGLVRPERPGLVWLWGALAAIAVIGGFTAWARAVHIIGREGIPHVNKMPHWLRRGWVVTGLGLVAPGSGLLLSGRADRAAITVWLVGPVALAAVILLNALGLWRHHMDSGWLAASGPALEASFLIAAGFLVLGFLAYIAQALQGMRQVMIEPGFKSRIKGDYYAVAVMAFVVVLVVVANPAQMAYQLDVGGDILREEGLQAIPLQLTLAASHLDPGKPEYTMQAMELYAELGQMDKAETLRLDLDRDLGTYVAMVQKQAVSEFGLARAGTSAPARPHSATGGRSRTGLSGVQQTADWTAQAAAAETGGVQSKSMLGEWMSGLNEMLFVGTLVGKKDTVPAVTDSVAAPRRSNASRTMGMPRGLAFPLSEADTSARGNLVPGE